MGLVYTTTGYLSVYHTSSEGAVSPLMYQGKLQLGHAQADIMSWADVKPILNSSFLLVSLLCIVSQSSYRSIEITKFRLLIREIVSCRGSDIISETDDSTVASW